MRQFLYGVMRCFGGLERSTVECWSVIAAVERATLFSAACLQFGK